MGIIYWEYNEYNDPTLSIRHMKINISDQIIKKYIYSPYILDLDFYLQKDKQAIENSSRLFVVGKCYDENKRILKEKVLEERAQSKHWSRRIPLWDSLGYQADWEEIRERLLYSHRPVSVHFNKSLAHFEEIKKQTKKLHECGTNNKSNLELYIEIGLYRSHVQPLSHVWLFCDSMDFGPPVSSVHGISQSRILKWVAISFSRGSSELRDQTCNSFIGRWVLYHWATCIELCKPNSEFWFFF